MSIVRRTLTLYSMTISYYFTVAHLQEFACREVHESSGDWIVYFTNYTELCTFREILETLWSDASLVHNFFFYSSTL